MGEVIKCIESLLFDLRRPYLWGKAQPRKQILVRHTSETYIIYKPHNTELADPGEDFFVVAFPPPPPLPNFGGRVGLEPM
jgi:hypothetical protein